MADSNPSDYTGVAAMFLTGAIIGLGQLLGSDQKLTWRIVLGRALSSGGLGLAAGSALAFIPDIPPLALYGLSAAIASLGTSFLERIVQRFLGIK